MTRQEFLQGVAQAVSSALAERHQRFLAHLRQGAGSEDTDVRVWAAELGDWAQRSDYCHPERKGRQGGAIAREDPVASMPVRYIKGARSGDVRRVIAFEKDLELFVEATPEQVCLWVRRFQNDRLIHEEYRAPSIVEFRRQEPRADELLEHLLFYSANPTGGDWLDLKEVIGVYRHRKPAKWPGGAGIGAALNIDEIARLFRLIDQIELAMQSAGIDDLSRWRFRAYVHRMREMAQPRHDPGAPSRFGLWAQRPRLEYEIALQAAAECSFDETLKAQIASIFRRAIERLDRFVAELDKDPRYHSEDPYDQPPSGPSDLPERAILLARPPRRELVGVLLPQQRREFDGRVAAIKCVIRGLTEPCSSWVDRLADLLKLPAGRRGEVKALMPPPDSWFTSFEQLETNAFALRSGIRQALTPAELVAWDALTVQPARSPYDHLIATRESLARDLEAIDELDLDPAVRRDATRRVEARHALSEAVNAEADLSGISNNEFYRRVRQVFDEHRDTVELPPTLSAQLQQRRLIIEQQLRWIDPQGTNIQKGWLPLLLDEQQQQALRRLRAGLVQQTQQLRDDQSLGLLDDMGAMVKRRQLQCQARARFREALTAALRAQWDAQTLEEVEEQQANASKVANRSMEQYRIAAGNDPNVAAQMRQHATTLAHLPGLELYRQAAREMPMTPQQQDRLMELVERYRIVLMNEITAIDPATYDVVKFGERARDMMSRLLADATALVGKAIGQAWAVQFRVVSAQVDALWWEAHAAGRPVLRAIRKIADSDAERDALTAILEAALAAYDSRSFEAIHPRGSPAEIEFDLQSLIVARQQLRAALSEAQREAFDTYFRTA